MISGYDEAAKSAWEILERHYFTRPRCGYFSRLKTVPIDEFGINMEKLLQNKTYE